jgi:hypothetical protein
VFGSSGDFAKAFKEAYTYQAPYQAAESAAAVHVYADAFKRAQSLDPEKVRDAIAATQLDTFYGPVKFDEAGRNIAKPMVLTQGAARQIRRGRSREMGNRQARHSQTPAFRTVARRLVKAGRGRDVLDPDIGSLFLGGD